MSRLPSQALDHEAPGLGWWREARFGMFIHWGLYAVCAGTWKGRTVPGIGEWIMAQFKIPLADYRTLARSFNPEAFDADAVVRLAKQAGMKYLVITAKHHEGFAMWDSKVSDYNIVKATPYGRDPMIPLAEACRRHGIRLCFYYSQALDWEHPDGMGNDWDFDPSKKNFQRYLDEKVKPQLTELLTGYGPVGLIWFDTPVGITREQSLEVKNLVKSIQPDCLVSGRIGHGIGDYGSLGDNQIPAGRLHGDWETPATINDTWGYKAGDRTWKSSDDLIRLLVDLAGKGVNYLLNIGPDADGRVPEESCRRLEDIGVWMQQNGSAIYGTDANPYPYEFAWGRMTRKNDRLNLILYRRDNPRISLRGLKTRVLGASLPAVGQALAARQDYDERSGMHDVTVTLPDTLPGELKAPFVVELNLEGPPEVDETCLQQPDHRVLLPAHMASLNVSPESARRNVAVSTNDLFAAVAGEAANEARGDHMRIGAGGLVENWHSERDSLAWSFKLCDAGTFDVTLYTVAAKYKNWVGGHRVRIRIGDWHATAEITPDEVVNDPRAHLFAERGTRIGICRLERPGACDAELSAEHINPADPAGLCISALSLTPVDGEAG